MAPIHIRPFQAADAEEVFDAALEAWHATYQNIFTTDFIDEFVRTRHAPERLTAIVPVIEARQAFFHIALDEPIQPLE
jgi:hypothetical protein